MDCVGVLAASFELVILPLPNMINTFREMQELLSVAWPYVDPDVAVVAFGRYG